MNLLEVINLTKYFKSPTRLREMFSRKPESVRAVAEVSFQVKAGRIFGLIGPNGAGKTTLLKILATLIIPDSGTALIKGSDILKDPSQVRFSFGLITGEERSFYWRLTGRQNLEFFAAFYNLSEAAASERIKYLIDLLEIETPDQRVGEYSTGMKQRLGIARSLLHDPPVLLMDEPTKSLDPGSVQKLRILIKEELCQKQKKSIILATHNLAEAEQICDQIGIMCQGKMVKIVDRNSIQVRGDLEKIYNQSVGAA